MTWRLGQVALEAFRNGEVSGEFKASSPIYSSPAYSGDRIFFGSNSEQLVVANSGNGNILKSLYLGEKITTRPVVYCGYVVVGTEGGNIILINPDNM